MKNNVYIINTEKKYKNTAFKPNYVELKNISITLESDKKIYDSIRNLFITMGLDKKNIGTKNWNPFSEFIKPGNHVLIKPNMVKHINEGPGDMDSLITNFSIIRPIIDYTILALNGTGKIIVGDAPVQECDFEKLKQYNNLENNVINYKSIYENISLIDFRKNQNPNIECQLVNMGQYSSFLELEDINKEYSITNYDLKLMNAHHTNGKHEYIIPKDVLDADVIINIPKPKSHRKAGMTACMKNFVGINGNKECLPHHRTGGPNKNGDEFPENSLVKNLYSYVSKYTYKKNKLLMLFRRFLAYLLKLSKKSRFREGSWYGNDTIWRTILDLNKLIMYVDKDGNLTNKQQRKIFNIADMVISGEKEGPLLPTNKKVGLIVASFNQLNMDSVIAEIMGFNPKKIKYIVEGYRLDDLKISTNEDFKIYDEQGIVKNINIYNKHFQPTDGWKDYLEEK